jgi:hypothetical protein
MAGKREFHITPGNILTPVIGFSNRVTGTPPAPARRGGPKEPGNDPVPKSVKQKSGAAAALKAFGLNGTGKGSE